MELYERIINEDVNAIDEFLVSGETVVKIFGDIGGYSFQSYICTNRRLIDFYCNGILTNKQLLEQYQQKQVEQSRRRGIVRPSNNFSQINLQYNSSLTYTSIPYKNISKCTIQETISQECTISEKTSSQKVSSELLIYEIGRHDATLSIKETEKINTQELQNMIMSYIL